MLWSKFVDAARPEQLHGAAHLGGKDLSRPVYAAFAARHQSVEVGASDERDAIWPYWVFGIALVEIAVVAIWGL